MHLDFLGLQAFVAIAEAGSFQQAATQLNLSQTAISHRMRKLEESLGVQLITRTSREFLLSEAGHALLPRARRAMQELSAACEAVRIHGMRANDWLCFACLPTIAAGVMAHLLADCAERFPEVTVRVFDGSIPEIVELVESRAAAFGITVMHAPRADLQYEKIGDEPFVLVCPESHRFAKLKRIAWDELTDEPLIRISLPSGNSMTIDDALGPLRDRLQWRYEAQHNALALDMVRGGLGLTVVPALSVQPRTGLAVVAIDHPAIKREIALLTRRDAQLPEREAWTRDALVRQVQAALVTMS